MKSLLVFICTYTMVVMGYAQTNYYVATSGSNTNPGTLVEPFETVQRGLNALLPNDTLNIMPGTYAGSFILQVGMVTIRNGATELPVLTGAGYGDAVIGLPDSTHKVNLIGLELANNIRNNAQGIVIYGPPSKLTIANCKIHDIHFSANPNATVNENTNAQGIIVYGTGLVDGNSNLLITGNELYNCRLGYSEGIAVNGNVSGFEISNNYVHNLTNIGIDAIGHEGTSTDAAYDQARNGRIVNNRVHDCISPYATSGGIYIDGAKNIIIERNTTYHNGYGIEVGCEHTGKSADSIVVRNNFVFDNQIAGIALGGYDYPSGSGKVTNTLIENNTLFMNDYDQSGSGELLVSYVEGAKVYNNILYSTWKSVMFYIEAGSMNITLDDNLYYCADGVNSMEFDFHGTGYTGLSAYQTDANQDGHSIYAVPGFVNPTLPNPNLHLQNSSTCINTGVSHSANTGQLDIDGEPRYNGTIDRGADEYYPNTDIANVAEIKASVYPNPTSAMCYVEAEDLESVTLYNLNGQQLVQQLTGAIDMLPYANGVYILRIETMQGRATRRIVKTAFDGQ